MQILIALPWKYHSHEYGTVPSCNGYEWANDNGTRIWLSAQLKELAVECAPNRWRPLIVRSRELAARVRQRCGDQSLFVTLCYLQLAADVGI
jgi:hypothetical protein